MLRMNRVEITGHVGRDPEIRTVPDGTKIVHLAVATSESWKDRNGAWKDRTQWHRVVIFNDRAVEYAEKHVRKGSFVYVQGALKYRSWNDPDGKSRDISEIVLDRFKGDLALINGQPPAEDTQS